MKNIENKVYNMEQARKSMFEALHNGDKDQQEKAFYNLSQAIQDQVMAEAKDHMDELQYQNSDNQVLVQRGLIPALTREEKEYFNEVVKREGFDNVEAAFPRTVIETVFTKFQNEHPIISKVDSQYTGGLLTWIFAVDNNARAYWGPICEDIKQIILGGFKQVDLKVSRLSGFIPVCKGMLELGPEWLAKYVMGQLYEIIAITLEEAIINGDGKEKPIGIMRKLSGATDGVYPEKPAHKLTEITPASMAGARAALAEAGTGNGKISLLVNPETYFAKIFGKLAYQKSDGEWISDRLATGEEIISSYGVPKDKIVIGNLENYFLAVAGKFGMDRYDQTLAIEDMDLFIGKMYATGLAKDPNAFFVLDVSGVTGVDVPALEEWAENTDSQPGA